MSLTDHYGGAAGSMFREQGEGNSVWDARTGENTFEWCASDDRELEIASIVLDRLVDYDPKKYFWFNDQQVQIPFGD